MAKTWTRAKDPDEVLDYEILWSTHLDTGDTIDTSVWVDVDSGITVDSDEFTDTATVIWLSGGTAGESYEMTNRITTDGGRTMDQTMKIKMKDR